MGEWEKIMADIRSNIIALRRQMPYSVKIVAVSKTKPAGDIMEAYEAGQRIFGENRVAELISKREQLPSDIEWHMIGHLQSNKVKQLISNVALIQSVDTFRLLESIGKESEKAGLVTDCLLQFHIADEETKTGFTINEAERMLGTPEFRSLNSVRVCGVMGMATYTGDLEKVHHEFRNLKEYFIRIKQKFFMSAECFREISMGMSGDYKIAIEEGATLVRIGSLIFGVRDQRR